MSAQDKVLDGAGLAVVNQIIGDKLDKKQDKLAAGDGTTVAGNKVNVTTPVQGIYTQAEYDALPEEQKNKGMYVIPDTGSGPGGGSSGEIYSAEETRIGTWIDGKPLYRKVYRKVVGNSELEEIANLSSLQIDFVAHIYGVFDRIDGVDSDSWESANHIYPSGNSSSLWISNPSLLRCANKSRKSSRITAIIEYTKTTDPATQEVTA